MIIKIIVIILFLLIIGSLASALFGLLNNDGSNRTVRALTFRIGLSIVAFLLLLLSAKLGWIQPTGLYNP